MKLTVIVALLCCSTAACAPILRDDAVANASDTDPAALVATGEALEARRDFRGAAEAYAEALRAGADEGSTLPKRIRASIAAKNFLPALADAKTALARRPHDSTLKFTIGALYAAMGAPDLARAHLESAAALRSFDADLQYSVAAVFRDELRNASLARRYFKAYLQVEPRGPHAGEARASLLAMTPE